MTSSHDSQVPHGVPPPEQFCVVPSRIRYADRVRPAASKRIAEAPPTSTSELDTSTQPPSSVGKQAMPSDASCQR
jgi:hypothetical protein